MAENSASGRSRAAATSRHVATIIQAAEDAAQAIHGQAEEQVIRRIAEGERAAQYRVQAAEEEAAEIIKTAQDEAARLRRGRQAELEQAKTAATSEALTIMANAQEQADAALGQAAEAAEVTRRNSEQRARELVLDAHAAADDVRAEGLELVSNLRQMGDALRSNAERLLRDVQLIHTRMVATLDHADGAWAPREGSSDRGGGRAARSSSTASPSARRGSAGTTHRLEDGLDVPEFIPPS